MKKKSQSIVLFFISCLFLSLLIFLSVFFLINEYKKDISFSNKQISIQNSFFSIYLEILRLTYEDNSTNIIYDKMNSEPFSITFLENYSQVDFLHNNLNYNYQYDNIIPFCYEYKISSSQRVKYFFNGVCMEIIE